MDDATTPDAFNGCTDGRRVSFVIQLTWSRLCYAKSVSGKDGDKLMEIATIIGILSRKEWYCLV